MTFYQDKSPERIPETLNKHWWVAGWLANLYNSNYSVADAAAALNEKYKRPDFYFNLDTVLKMTDSKNRDK